MTNDSTAHAVIGDAALLQRIDQLFACGASQYVDIPQIVVIGDQSAGKSSVLSSLIGKDLPRDASLCTRYPTKLIFRRSTETSLRIRVIADAKATDEHKKLIKSIQTWEVRSWDELNLEDVMKAVNSKIGIKSGDKPSDSGTIFSKDILEIEISGPDQDHYSVIDVPGIFRDPEPGKTTEKDMDFVRSMVKHYMESPRSVMLAVIPANCDVATQEILQMAQKVDPEGDRTLGVLTKPDLVDEGAEDRVIDLLQGRTRKLKLGWHIVRNAGQKALNNKDLNKRELEREFFEQKSPWNTIDPESWGTDSLVGKLREVLGSLVEREFSQVKQDVRRQLQATQQELKNLGPARSSRPARSAFLTDLSTEFQALVRNALTARTGMSDVFTAHPELKLAPLVVGRMEAFEKDMDRWGHCHPLRPTPGEEAENLRESKRKGIKSTRQQMDVPELDDVLEPACIINTREATDPNSWLRDLYKNNRGFELGTFDPAILPSAMREQTPNWALLSRGYTSDIIVIIHNFIRVALRTICKNERLENNLYNHIETEIKNRYIKATEQAEFILSVELNGQPMTLNHYFNENLQKHRHSRISELLLALNVNPQQPPTLSMSNQQYIVQDIGDILSSYYKVARKRFVDNICQQATHYFLVNGPNTPLTVFSPNLVSLMTDKQLEEIAGEEDRVKKQRDKLNRDIANLEKIRNILST